jgi:hypothetical protein
VLQQTREEEVVRCAFVGIGFTVQHWPCCSRLEKKRWFGVHLLWLVSLYSTGRAAADSRRRGGSVCICWDWFHCTALAVLYTIGGVGFVLFSRWWAWWCPKHVETPINTSSFLHLVGYLFTFMIQYARSHDIQICSSCSFSYVTATIIQMLSNNYLLAILTGHVV